jgi:hypothetical protein
VLVDDNTSGGVKRLDVDDAYTQAAVSDEALKLIGHVDELGWMAGREMHPGMATGRSGRESFHSMASVRSIADQAVGVLSDS